MPEIQEILKQPGDVQNWFFDQKWKEGIYKYNFDLISQEKEPAMRERKPVYEDKLRTCSKCYYNKYFHIHKCQSKSPAAIKPTLLQKTNVKKIDSDKEFQDILNRFLE